MFELLAKTVLAQRQMLKYADATTHVSEAIGEDYLFNTEGNNKKNALKLAGVNIDSWCGMF